MSSRKLRAIARRLWGPKTPSFVEAPISSTLSAGLPSRYQLAIEDEPADAAVEVLPRALEAFNESRWPGHDLWPPTRHLYPRLGSYRGRRRRNLRRVTRRCGRSSRAAVAADWRPPPLAARSAPLRSHALPAAARMRQAAPAPARWAVTATAAPAAVGSLSATGPR